MSPAGCRERVSSALFSTPGMWTILIRYRRVFSLRFLSLVLVMRSVAEYLQEWLVVDHNGEVVASKDKMPHFV